MFALMCLALLFYLRVLYVRRQRRKNGSQMFHSAYS